MFCSKCGNKLSEDNKFCMNCGAAVAKDVKISTSNSNASNKEVAIYLYQQLEELINKWWDLIKNHQENKVETTGELEVAVKETLSLIKQDIREEQYYDNETDSYLGFEPEAMKEKIRDKLLIEFCDFDENIENNNDEFTEKNSLNQALINIGEYRLAGFWIRLGAYLIDLFIITLITTIWIVLVMFSAVYLLGIELTRIDYKLINIVLFYFIAFLYESISICKFSTTIGKKLYGLRVFSTVNNSSSITLGQAFERSCWQKISLLFWGCGYWSMGNNDFRQTFHDSRAKTMVKRKNKVLIFPIILTIIVAVIILIIIAQSEG